MIIKISRHGKRRAKLYNIPESTMEEILKDLDLQDGEHEAIKDVQGFKYPIKIVVSVEGNILTVSTNYPLKKGRRQ
jgi:sulfur carrier protein ThiS